MRIKHAGLTKADPGQYEASDQSMDGKIGEHFPGKPELGDTGVVGGRVPDGQGRGQVLVQGGHDDHRERGVEQVVTPDKDGIKHTLHKDKDWREKTRRCVRFLVRLVCVCNQKLDGIFADLHRVEPSEKEKF